MKNIYSKTLIITLFMGISFIGGAQTITTFAGDSAGGFSGDGGPASDAELLGCYDAVVDATGNIYIADSFNNRIRKVNTSGIISTIAGNGYGSPLSGGWSGDGAQATLAELYFPNGVAVDTSGNVYISDFKNEIIRKIVPSGIISTISGNGIASYSGDGGPAIDAELNGPTGIALDAHNNIYIADYYNSRVRIINTSDTITTFAGNGVLSYSGDGGPATSAELYKPCAMTPDSPGNLYIADYDNSRVRLVNSSGIISTFAGNGVLSFSGDGGPASSAELDRPANIALDASGNVYIADYNNNRIRIVSPSGTINTFAGNGVASYSGDGGPAINAEMNSPTSVALDASGNLYIADWDNSRIRMVSQITTGINAQLKIDNGQWTIYPVPTTGQFTITGIKQGQLIELYNYTGQRLTPTLLPCPQAPQGRLKQQEGVSVSCQINISSFPNGIYLIRILNKDGSVFSMKKVVKTE